MRTAAPGNPIRVQNLVRRRISCSREGESCALASMEAPPSSECATSAPVAGHSSSIAEEAPLSAPIVRRCSISASYSLAAGVVVQASCRSRGRSFRKPSLSQRDSLGQSASAPAFIHRTLFSFPRTGPSVSNSLSSRAQGIRYGQHGGDADRTRSSLVPHGAALTPKEQHWHRLRHPLRLLPGRTTLAVRHDTGATHRRTQVPYVFLGVAKFPLQDATARSAILVGTSFPAAFRYPLGGCKKITRNPPRPLPIRIKVQHPTNGPTLDYPRHLLIMIAIRLNI